MGNPDRGVQFATPHSQAVGAQTSNRIVIPWWLWANVLSFDAALIAVLWHLLLAKSFGVNTGFLVPAILGCSVWVIYAGDHLLDVRHATFQQGEPARKEFFRKHRSILCGLASGALLLTAWFASRKLNPAVWRAGISGAVLVIVYLGFVHLLPGKMRPYWPREAVVALLFSWGVCMPVWVQDQNPHMPIAGFYLLLFLLCWLNCCVVETWEWRSAGKSLAGKPNAIAQWMAAHLSGLSCFILLLAAILFGLQQIGLPFLGAVFLSTSILLATAQFQGKLSISLLCVLLDLALCAPLPILLALQLR